MWKLYEWRRRRLVRERRIPGNEWWKCGRRIEFRNLWIGGSRRDMLWNSVCKYGRSDRTSRHERESDVLRQWKSWSDGKGVVNRKLGRDTEDGGLVLQREWNECDIQ